MIEIKFPGITNFFDPSLASLDAARLFDAQNVPVFDLYLPPEEWRALQKNARDEAYIPANACFQGRAIGEVGLRFKGNVGSLDMCFDEQPMQADGG